MTSLAALLCMAAFGMFISTSPAALGEAAPAPEASAADKPAEKPAEKDKEKRIIPEPIQEAEVERVFEAMEQEKAKHSDQVGCIV